MSNKQQNFFSIDIFGNKIERQQAYSKKKINTKLDALQLNIGIYILTPLILAVIIGKVLDSFFNTDRLFLSIGLFFGIISVFYNLYKLVKQHASH